MLKFSTVSLHAYNKFRRRPRDTDIERLDAFLEELTVIHLALSQGGLSGGQATAGVAVYRLISFFLVALIGAGAWLLVKHADARLAVQARAVAAACTSGWQAIRAKTWPGPVTAAPPAGPESDNGNHGER